MNPHTQWLTLMWMLLSGMAMGVVFDSYRVLSIRFHFVRWSIHMLDVLYWVASALFIFRVLYASNRGELRFYVFLGLLLGVCLYFWAFSVTTQRFVVMLLEIVRRLALIVNSILRILIIHPVLLLYRLVCRLIRWTLALIVFLGRMLIYILMPVWKPILWMVGPLKARFKIPASLVQLGVRLKNTAKRWFGRR
ncbi:spore cortex biosynthesis protein YabQ [Paenibacillus farraposensis]|uniref:Spore cortex biosynthesis protein YabQ n=1 Tax=Paenibacillus farraposensis TaxID=2807095 RepID=A0ABW4DDJ4_9BACL|nr:spore cortex biosynthesis protein YabQ [Paenibacillus farraposensis]MCC3380854.1 spore cortex biosynthesis protein YabQ [Paenibacillus farraposensis]